jgi:ABC-type glycerol-3-phosphate transport system substrate-binding protein
MKRWVGIQAIAVAGILTLVAGACTGGDEEEQGTGPVTITMLDYYGEATPFAPDVIARFEQENPGIKVKYEPGDWDSMHEKFTVRVSSGDSPDVATMDMTWIPTFASNGIFADLTDLSGGQLNGEPIEDQYQPGALEAMTFDDKYVTMMFDFDAYSLYYRADQFRKKGIDVPTTWEELRAAAKQLAEDTDGDGTCDKFCFEVYGNDCFHWCQFLFQAGGEILTPDETAAAFNSSEGLAALEFYRGFIDDGSGIYWGDAQGEPIRGIKDERLGMFLDGPYYMGLLKSGAPDQKGKWAVAQAPYSVEPGSYLGGTGLSIPVNAPHPQEAWTFIEFMLQPEQQVGVFTLAGAAPATTAALESPELTKPDPYFGGQAPFSVFLDSMATATHFPYVEAWDPIDTDIGNMVQSVMLGDSEPQEALDTYEAKVNEELAG